LLCTDDTGADVRGKAGANCAASRFRKFSSGNNSTYDSAARLSNRWPVDVAKAVHGARDRSGWGACIATARTAGRLVSLVVVATNEIPVSRRDAGLIRDQSHSRSWDRARQARSSIVIDVTGDDRDLRGMESGVLPNSELERVERSRLGTRNLGVRLRTARVISDRDGDNLRRKPAGTLRKISAYGMDLVCAHYYGRVPD